MRFATCIMILAFASWGSLTAQGIIFGRRPSPSVQPSFQIRGFNSSTSPLRLNKASLQRIDLAATSGPVSSFGTSLTCPMPVAHTDSANDRMPVARGGTTEPMPVARSGCSNPLDPSH